MTTTAAPGRRPAWRGVVTLLRAPVTPPAWLSTAQVVTGLALASVASTVVIAIAVTVASLVVTAVLAVPFLAALLGCGRVFTGWQRSRLAAFTGVSLPPVEPWPAAGASWPRRLWAETRSPRAWRQLGYHALSGFTGSAAALIVIGCWSFGAVLSAIAGYRGALPDRIFLGLDLRRPAVLVVLTALGLVLLLAAPWVAGLAGRFDTAITRAMLSPSRSERLAHRVDSLAKSRAGVIDAADAERRRIERDLHDGTQQRLVSLAMNLGMTRAKLEGVPEGVRADIEQAHNEAKLALSELRDVVRGLHPAVLDDRGLDAALSGIAARSPVPVRLHADLPHRPPAAVEAVAYFVVSEALANVAKHAGASQVDVAVELVGDTLLRVSVSDNGQGGADPDCGSGLRGLEQRVRSVDGSMTIDSPPGGPTVIVVELPCAR